MADDSVNFSQLTAKTTPADADVYLTEDTEDTKKITFVNLVSSILSRLTSKIFSELNTVNKTVIGAINEIIVSLSGKSDTGHTHAWGSITGKPTTFAPSAHNHDERYYTETETDTLLYKKSDTTHTHAWSTIISKPTTFPPSSHIHDDRYYTESEVDALLVGSDIEITIGDGFTAEYTNAKKIGNLVVINFKMLGNISANQTLSLGRIPSEYAPGGDVYGTGHTGVTGPTQVRIDENGIIWCWSPVAVISPRGSLVYIL